jgi:hypothetical protein
MEIMDSVNLFSSHIAKLTKLTCLTIDNGFVHLTFSFDKWAIVWKGAPCSITSTRGSLSEAVPTCTSVCCLLNDEKYTDLNFQRPVKIRTRNLFYWHRREVLDWIKQHDRAPDRPSRKNHEAA